ncbi:MAG: glycoside hydrolase family 3 C-terminal domain-containing protein [Spirochaetales bacterium]|nr:glycoside hydrolase family 3 C-terminal domain-containing protein [Spirochaetales bacterium]
MKRLIIIFLLIPCTLVFGTGNGENSNVNKDDLDVIIGKMTLREKIFQLSGDKSGFATEDIGRLGIQGLIMSDGPHGVRWGKATCFPSTILLGATWDPDLVYRVGVAMGTEFRAKGRYIALAPCINVIRDPRGGRSFETFGEDPYHISRLASAIVRGIQSRKVVAVVKHYACNNQENNRFMNNARVREEVLREIYLPGFKAAVTEAGAWGIMAAYNLVNGSYCSENNHLLNDILKNEWDFQGFVVSDWGATHSTVKSINSGQDIEMPNGSNWGEKLLNAVRSGQVSEQRINDAVKRTLKARKWAGVMDKPLLPDRNFDFAGTHKAIVLEAAQKGIVLLKNTKNVLPLDREKVKSIAVIGPNADIAQPVGGGSSWVNPYYAVSPLEGIKNMAGPEVKVAFARGSLSSGNSPLYPIDSNLITNTGKPELKGFAAEYFNNQNLSGNPVLKRNDVSIDFDWRNGSPDRSVKKDHFSVRWSGRIKAPKSGKYTFATTCDDGVNLYINGKKVISDWHDHAAETKLADVDLEEGKEYSLVMEYYENGGDASAKLTWAKPYDLDKMITEAREAAAGADVAIVCVGNGADIESEGFDRKTLKLPGRQDKLISEVAAVNKNTIVVIIAGPGIFMDWLDEVASVVQIWFAGQEEGNALASVLFGDYNPAGRLPVTYPKNLEQMPVYGNDYETLDEGRGYRYYFGRKTDILFPFGYGLSYTQFGYSGFEMPEKIMGADQTLTVSCKVKNEGRRKGEEVVQLYLCEKGGRGYRGTPGLKGFRRIALDPQETVTVTFEIRPEDISCFSLEQKKFIPEPGLFEVFIGASYTDIKFRGDFEVK